MYGNSVTSIEGNGAIILTVPDAPTDLANNALVTSGSQIGLTWNQGVQNGGTPVIDFTISYKYDAEPYTVLASAITSQSYTAVGLAQSTQYTFKVLSRNSYGPGAYSSEILILAGQTPDPVSTPVTTITGLSVHVNWEVVSTGGSSILGYRIYIR